MTYRGDFDPSLFDQDQASTWPPSPPGGYSPGDWYYVTGPGTVNGDQVDVGFRVFPVGTGRRYGHLDYGDAVYGGPVPAEPWPADPDVVWWRGRRWSDAPAWQRPPAPYDGAPFGDTGWRISVAVLASVDGARLYGDGTYGDAVYGDTLATATDWLDQSCPIVGVVIRRGSENGGPFVDVDTAQLDVLDVDGDLYPLLTVADTTQTGGIVRDPGVGSALRVALIGPSGDPWPLCTGRIERVEDRADTPGRVITVDVVGMVGDLVTAVDLNRGPEPADDRVAWLVDRAGYAWGIDPAPTPAPTLRRIDPIDAAPVRERADLAALSAGWQMTTDTSGVIRFRDWPTVPNGVPIGVTDRIGAADLPIVTATVTADRGELVNVATVESESVQGSEALSATATDPASVGRFGRSTQGIGFPVSGLSAQSADLQTLADNTVDRFGALVNRVTQITVDTAQDDRWLAVLADLDHGAPVTVSLTKPIGRSYDAAVTGCEYRITPGRIAADIYLSTTTPTL